jgi:hypothetical protein
MFGGGCSCSPVKQLENGGVNDEIDRADVGDNVVHSEWGKVEILSDQRLLGSRCLARGCRRGVDAFL